MHFRDHVLLYTLVPLIILLAVASGYRFMVRYDYNVMYEAACDPTVQSCFIGCGNDECTETYYYAEVQKYAADLYAQCGADITGCEAAAACLPGERDCSVTYCDLGRDGKSCESIVGEFKSGGDSAQVPGEEGTTATSTAADE